MAPRKNQKKKQATRAVTPERSSSSRRRSQRVSSGGGPGSAVNSTGKRSIYFEGDNNDSDGEDEIASLPPSARKAKSVSDASVKRGKASRKTQKVEDSEGGEDDEDAYQEDDIDSQGSDEEEEEEGAEEDEDEETPPPPPSRKRGRPSSNGATAKTNKKVKLAAAKKPQKTKKKPEDEDDDDVDDEAFKNEDEDEDDGSPRITFTPLPPLRPEGPTPYSETRVHPNTLAFLGDLKANNTRPWLKLHDAEFRRSLKDWESFVLALTERIQEADPTIPELPAKDVIFRIYRDVRFSKDPTPYKPHYSAAWSRTGRKGRYACYYIHAEPGGSCFVGGGMWCPDKEALASLRASVDERPGRWRRMVMDSEGGGEFGRKFLSGDDGLRPKFELEPGKKAEQEKKEKEKEKQKQKKGGGEKKKKNGKKEEEGKGKEDEKEELPEEEKLLLAFAEANRESALKKCPQNFHPEHRDIRLLRLRNFTVGRKVADEDLQAEDAVDRIMGYIEPMVGFITFLNRIVMPDPGEDSSDEDDEE